VSRQPEHTAALNGVCLWYSRVGERVRLHKELKVLYRQGKAEPPRQQSYVDRVRLERLVPVSDHFLQDYMDIIKLARELIDNPKPALRNAIFSFDTTLGVSIFSLSRLCKDRKLRREAIDLLHRCPQREGWFDALVFAKISAWLMEKEEAQAVNGLIPDTARWRLIKHELGQYNQTVKLYCSRLVLEDGNSVRKLLPPVTIVL
jgi:hypothetical protein